MFERRGIKIFVVAAASNPSPFGELRDCLEAETDTGLTLACKKNHVKCVENILEHEKCS